MFQAINWIWIQKTGVGGSHKFQMSSKWYWSELPIIHRMWWPTREPRTRSKEGVLSPGTSLLSLGKSTLQPRSHFVNSRTASFSRDRCHHWRVLCGSTPPSGVSFCSWKRSDSAVRKLFVARDRRTFPPMTADWQQSRRNRASNWLTLIAAFPVQFLFIESIGNRFWWASLQILLLAGCQGPSWNSRKSCKSSSLRHMAKRGW